MARLNVPVVGMSASGRRSRALPFVVRGAGRGLPDPGGVRPISREVLAEAVASSSAPCGISARPSSASRARGTRSGDGVRVTLATGEEIAADALVLATGVELPPRLPYLEPLAGDPRLIRDPWAAGALDAIGDGESVAILGSSLTAIDVTGSILNSRPRSTVIALSRHGNLPERHEDPWRPRLPEPVFTIDEFFAFDSPFERALERIRSFGDDWPRAVNSLRPISQALWIAMDDSLRARLPRSLPQSVGHAQTSRRARDRV